MINLFNIKKGNSLGFAKAIVFGLLLVFSFWSNRAESQVSLSFSSGYLGTQASATQNTNNIKTLATLGIARVSFSQSYPGTFGGTQGNDLSGVIRLYMNSGRIITLNGALNWRETTGNALDVFGLIFDPGQNASITYGANQTYNIIGGNTNNTSTSLGLKAYASSVTFTDGTSRSGNAATSSIVADMNTELANTPQPTTIALASPSVVEGQNLVYTVTLSAATTAGRPMVYTFNTTGSATKGSDFNTTYTFSNSVIDNGDGTITVPGGVSSFTITVSTIDDNIVESIENVLLSIGSKSALGLIRDNDAPTFPSCDVNNPYDKIISGYHQSIATKTDATFSVWGEDLDNSGAGSVLTPMYINVSNFPNLAGTPLKAAIGGQGGGGKEQAILLTTSGLFVWGNPGFVIDAALTTNATFAKILTNQFTANNVNTSTGLPLGVNPYDVKMMTASYGTLIILTNSGDVWTLSKLTGTLNANGSTTIDSKTWYKVKTSSTTYLTDITSVRVQASTASLNAVIALKADGTVYTWGASTYLGNATSSTTLNYATQMTLPAEFSITNIPKMIAVTGGTKNTSTTKNTLYILSNTGALYAVGDNTKKQIGDFSTTERTSWVNCKINNTTNFSNVSFITAQEHDASFPGIAIVTKTGDLYTWGENEGLALGRNDSGSTYTNWDPGMPLGFTSGSDIALSAELGGHTLVYIKQGTSQFCYVGHKTSGSMGDGVSASSFINTFNCTGTPSLNICGSVPIAASTITSVISANPTTINANGTSTSVITVQLKQSNGTNLTSTGGTVIINTSKGSISGVTDNNNGTYTAILTSSTFVETASLTYTLNGASGTNSASVNFIIPVNPTITTTGALKTFTTCSGCTVTPQSFTVSGTDLSTNNLVVTAPTGVQVSTVANSGYATSINIAPTAGTVTTTTVYVKLTNNATSVASGLISVTSTGATAKTLSVTTNTDNALNFDGVDDNVSLSGSIGNAYNNSAVTIEAWIKTTASKNINEILAWGSTTAINNVVEFRTSGGNLQFVLNDGVKFYSLTSSSFINTGKWVHVAVVKSGTTVNLYINGQIAASTAAGDVTSTPSLDIANIGVLKYKSPTTYGFISNSYFSGDIDQVRVWNTARTSSDIASNMFVEMAGNETGLVANYDFNQGIANGTNSISALNDNSTNAYSGTLSGFASTGTTSNFVTGFIPAIQTTNNNALSFDGSNDYVLTNVDGSTLNAFTIETFINPANTTQNNKGILQWASGSITAGNPMVLFQQNGTQLSVYVNSGYNLSTTLTANTWSHIALTYANSLYTLYVNGVSVATYSGSLSLQQTATQFYLGTGYNGQWNGLMDEVRIWNVAKSASEIANNMYNDLAGTESGLMAYYNFNQGFANGTNTGIASLTDKTSNNNSGVFNNFALTGSVSNFVVGNTQVGSSATIRTASTYQLSNNLTGGVWSSSNTAIATVDPATGLVTGVAAGAASVTYTICSKSVSFPVTIYAPTITVNSALKTFTSCSGCAIPAQSFTIAGTNLGANVIVTAPYGFEVSNVSSGTYSSTLSLDPSLVSGSPIPIYLRLVNNASSVSNGNISVTSTGAVSRTISITVNTDNALMLDGVDDHVDLGDVLDISSLPFTKEAWVFWKGSSNAYSEIITKDVVQAFAITNSNKLHANFGNGSTWGSGVNSTTSIPLNKWTHVAVTRDANGVVKLYINGVLDASTATLNFNGSTSGVTLIGAKRWSNNTNYENFFNGAIDNIKVWNVEKTASEIANNMYVELNGSESNLLAYYNFNQGIASGTNSSIITLSDFGPGSFNGTLTNISKTGTTSNFVAGLIPDITAAGNATTVLAGGTLALSNGLTGGTWSSTNTNVATINTSTGLITGVAGGNTTLNYTICGKVVTYNITVLVPTLTTSSLKTFTSCSGCTITPQSFTVAGVNLGANAVISAPTGFEIATAIGGTYSSTITLTPSAGTITSTPLYVRLINSTTTVNSGNITVASTGAASKTVTATVNTDNAMNFDGVNDYVILDNVGNNSNLTFSGTSNFTIEAWVKRDAATGNLATIVSKQNSNVAGNYIFYIGADGKPGLYRETSPYDPSLIATTALPLNEWHHIAGVFDGSSLKIYIDGTLNNSKSQSLGITNNSNISTLKVAVGASFNSSVPAYLFNGSIDEVRIWNVGRTATQIQNNYLTELAGNESNLVAYYNFNQGTVNGTNTSITTLNDRTTNAINGTNTNFALTGTGSNFVAGLIPTISGAAIVQDGTTSNYTNALTGGSWASSATGVATINPTTGVVTGVSAGNSTITYTICNKTVSKLITIVDPTITTTGTLTAFTTCASTNSTAQTFTVSAQYLTANLVLTAPSGYEMSLTSGGTYTNTLSFTPTSGTVAATIIYVRTTNAIVNGQSGNINITSTGATSKTVATGNAVVTQNRTASVTISSNATNNTICSGSSITFTATPVNGGTSPIVQWKKNGVNIPGAVGLIYSVSGLSDGDIMSAELTSSLSSCIIGSPALSNTITVRVISVPVAPGVISGPSTICMNSNQVYSVSAVTGATSYTWVVTGNLTATASTNNVINITAGNTSGSGTIKVLASNTCGSSAYSNVLNITVNNTPAPTAAFTASNSTVCLTSPSVSFTNNSTANTSTNATITSYSWDFGDASTVITTANASRTYTGSGTFDAVLTITDAASCSSSISSRITVDPISVAGTASAANTTICEGTNTTLTLTGNTGSIQWQSSTDGINFTNITGATAASYITGNLTSTTYYQAVVTSGACSSATSGVVTVTVSPTPSVTLGQVANVFATSTSFDLSYSNAIGNPTEYSIATTTPNAMAGFTAINGYGILASPITVAIPASAIGTYNFNLTVANGALGCTSSIIPFTVTVVVAPPANLSYNTPNVYTVGGGAITPLNPTSTGGPITQYTIGPSLPPGLTINPTTGVISGTPSAVSSQTSYTVTGTNASGTVTATVVITVNVAPPASLSYNTPNVYTTGTSITPLNPTSTGGPITQYTIGPSLPAGLSIDPTTGIISGTPSAVSSQTSYTVTGTNVSGTVTATVVITVNSSVIPQPQGSLDAVDFDLLASDTVKLKLTTSNGTAPFTLILSNSVNTSKDTITNLTPTNNVVEFLQKRLDTTKLFTIFKLIDANNNTRTSGFTKDTTIVHMLRPNIALTLKADKAIKQPDNSFKTKLLLKIKNTGQINLRNVQVNANLSEVFPAGINYVLDSVSVINGNIRLSSNYRGNGTATSPSSVKRGVTASSGIISNAILDANYLLDNGVNLAINEEADVNFYLSIAPTTQSVVLKLQFSSAGDGVLNKNGGYTSQQSSTAVSDNGTNLATHPNNTSIGTPLPTYLPLFPVESIAAALKASNPTPVVGGYTFDFVAKAKNFSNMNLDTVAIFNDMRKTFTNPDTAYIIGVPVVTGGAVFNTNYNGYSDTLLIDSTAKLAVGDSITVSYTLFVGTNKTSGSWSNAIFASGHATLDYNYVWDISTDGTNPDPNGDGDPKEQGKTYFYINFTPPGPPTVDNKTYLFGTATPPTIGGLVKTYPIGTIPVWCDVQTALCSPVAPPTPTIIGKYVYQLKSYDTTTKLYSVAFVNDTVIIKPPVPIVNDSTYIIGQSNNPANVSVQVKAMTGGTLKYFLKTILLNSVPVLGTTPSVISYTVSQVVNQVESDTTSFKVTLLSPNDVLHLQKIAGEAQLQSNSSFNIPFTFIARNVLSKQLDSVLITDNLLASVNTPNTFTVVSLSSTGSLVSNTNFNGKTDINLTQYASKLAASAIDTIKLVINVVPNGYAGALQNTAVANAKSPYGKLTMNSTSRSWSSSETTKYPTTYTIPDLRIDIPEGFSPNRDGVNDKFVIIKPFGTILDLEVYNRWGNVVYANANYNNEWDGKGTNNFIGQDLMDGGYYYTLKAKSPNGNVQIFKGFVLIQR